MYISPDHVPFLPCYDCHTTSTTVIMTNGSSAELTPLAMPSLISTIHHDCKTYFANGKWNMCVYNHTVLELII